MERDPADEGNRYLEAGGAMAPLSAPFAGYMPDVPAKLTRISIAHIAITSHRLRGDRRHPARLRRLRTRPDYNGERSIWLEPHVLNKLRYLRGAGESYSNLILKPVEVG